MSTSLQFIPRKVAQKQGPRHSQHYAPSQPVVSTKSTSLSGSTPLNDNEKEKDIPTPSTSAKKPTFSDEDYVVLVSLALSDYALWSDPELRREIDGAGESREEGRNNEAWGFVSLRYALRQWSTQFGLKLESCEVAIAKALRSGAQDVFEVRLIVFENSVPNWKRRELGNYEIRRKDWLTARQVPSSYTRDYWEKRTVYLENIPVQYRTIPQIIQFTLSLISADSAAALHNLKWRVQGIAIPSHHQDKPGDPRRFNGFAFVTLANVEEAESLLNQWPWDHQPSSAAQSSESISDCGSVEAVREARKFRFKTLSKRQWEVMKDEYLAYRQQLLDEVLAFQDAENALMDVAPEPEHEANIPSPGQGIQHNVSHSAPFPVDCLVFVRNIHPETNKTTIRALFSTAFRPKNSGILQGSSDGLDYVDFTKGVDSCHLRLKSPLHAQVLVDHFTRYPKKQTHGLDDTGTADPHTDTIIMEIVRGRREELYWEKVPEKVRRKAVLESVKLAEPGAGGEGEGGAKGEKQVPEGRKRKKRKIGE